MQLATSDPLNELQETESEAVKRSSFILSKLVQKQAHSHPKPKNTAEKAEKAARHLSKVEISDFCV